MTRVKHSRAEQFRFQRLLLAVVLVLAALAAVWSSTRYAGQSALAELAEQAEVTLDLQTETVIGQLEKYRYLPAVLSRHPDVLTLYSALAVNGETSDAMVMRARQLALETTVLSGALDTVFVMLDGTIIASAEELITHDDMIGTELLLAPEQGRLGRAPITVDDDKRAYAFSSPVRLGNRVAGHVVTALSLDLIEQTWALIDHPVFSIDGQGQLVARNLLSQGFDLETLKRLARTAKAGDGFQTIQIEPGDGVQGEVSQVEYIPFTREILILDWTLIALKDYQPVARSLQNAAVIALLSSLLLSAFAFWLLLRWQSQISARRIDQANALRLERRVRDRTRELRETNERLEGEIAERIAAETALKLAQNELVKSAKLAAIGQMSAAISHEYNQPLAAIRSYSDNATLMLDREKLDDAKSNLGLINGLVDRMASLSKTLRSFARKPGTADKVTDLNAAIDDAIVLLSPVARERKVTLEVDKTEQSISVFGGHVRLSQVFVNLVSNAMDACSGSPNGSVRVSVGQKSDKAVVMVEDNGHGLDEADIEHVFDPFFTTKDVGEGLGLGLSIAYNIVRDFGGTLTAENVEPGGARFTVCLKQVKQDTYSGDGRRAAE